MLLILYLIIDILGKLLVLVNLKISMPTKKLDFEIQDAN